MESADKKALQLFHDAARRVPAYKDFLKRSRVNPARIKTIKDFAHVPVTDAKNYIAAYPVEKRCWDGKIAGSQLIATSSGTSGEPKFWPRSAEQDIEAARIHEGLYKMYFGIDKRSTLILIGYPMGIYISGIATLLPTWLLSALKKYPVTVMSIGNNKAEMLRAVRNLSGLYDQTILIGHPFFIKDVIETGVDEGIKWARANLGLMFCSGGFSEAWREYVAKKAGIKPSAMRIFNTYGSSEMLLMGYETYFTIAIKRTMEKDVKFLKDLTGDVIAPLLFQYNPSLRYIESVESNNGSNGTVNELVFTSDSGIPLMRFNLHDRGDVIPLNRVNKMVREYMPSREATKISALVAHSRLPLITMYGRSDDTLKFHAVNIYPEHVKAGLMERKFMRALTGKFVMRKRMDRKMDESLEINVELTPKERVSKHLEREIKNRVIQKLRKVNLEYLDMSTHLGAKTHPRIVLRPYQDIHYFKPGLKPKFIDRT